MYFCAFKWNYKPVNINKILLYCEKLKQQKMMEMHFPLNYPHNEAETTSLLHIFILNKVSSYLANPHFLFSFHMICGTNHHLSCASESSGACSSCTLNRKQSVLGHIKHNESAALFCLLTGFPSSAADTCNKNVNTILFSLSCCFWSKLALFYCRPL